MKNIFVVNYKEVAYTINAEISDIECGVCEVGYTDENEARNFCKSMAVDKKNELGADANLETNESLDWFRTSGPYDECTYWVTMVSF